MTKVNPEDHCFASLHWQPPSILGVYSVALAILSFITVALTIKDHVPPESEGQAPGISIIHAGFTQVHSSISVC